MQIATPVHAIPQEVAQIVAARCAIRDQITQVPTPLNAIPQEFAQIVAAAPAR